MCTKEQKRREVSAFPGISPGWDVEHPACLIDCKEVGVRAWVDEGCIPSMGSGRARETAVWCCKGTRSSPGRALRGPMCTFCTLQDQPNAWMLPEPSLRWVAPQLQLFQEEPCTQLTSHSSLYMPNPRHGGTRRMIPNPPARLLLEGKGSWTESGEKYSPRTWPCCTPGEDLLHCAWSQHSFFTGCNC